MNGGKTIAFVLIIIAIAGMYLHAGGQLGALYTHITTPPNTVGQPTQHLATILIAIVIYILIISQLPPDDAAMLTGIVLLGAILVNHQNQGQNDLVSTITGLIQGK